MQSNECLSVAGTDINSLDRSGRTPLHLAVGHLRLLHQDRDYSSEQLKAAVTQVQIYNCQRLCHMITMLIETELSVIH